MMTLHDRETGVKDLNLIFAKGFTLHLSNFKLFSYTKPLGPTIKEILGLQYFKF